MVAPLFFVSILSTLFAAALAVYASFWWKKKEIDRARHLADELGFDFELRTPPMLEKVPAALRPLADMFSPWRISGSLRGLSAWVYPETRSSGKSSKTYLIVRAYYDRPLPFDLRAGRETVFTKIGKALFNLSDVETGDWELDEAVRFKSSDPSAVSTLFGRSEVREAFLALLKAFPEAVADQEGALWERTAVRAAFAQVPSVLDSLSSFAAAVSAARA